MTELALDILRIVRMGELCYTFDVVLEQKQLFLCASSSASPVCNAGDAFLEKIDRRGIL